ncbi:MULTISPECIES: OadG family protein [Thalassotalea]|uniref:OadG family protein n=1 Tax=Thalassotalea TaxID=1518149 RepID=UPI00094320E5|nr:MULTISPECIES: OadG family transporter subunit [Thalassotalea]OKY27728.1 oxaloacetate decarboxylase subunit gamma [Thalassotalea sp. PP2-459]
MDSLLETFIEAGTLMLAGMVFVFAFLGLLVIFINLVLVKLANKYPDPIIQSKSKPKAKKTNIASNGVTPQVVAAIGSAVTQYKQKHGDKA